MEACASLEDGASAGEPPLEDEVANEALPAEEEGSSPPRAKWPSLALFRAWRTRPPDKLILGSYVKPLEWSHPSVDASHLIRKLLSYSSENETRDAPNPGGPLTTRQPAEYSWM